MKTLTLSQLKNSTAVPFSRLLESLSPELAARWAAQMFTTAPKRLVLKDEERAVMATGHRFTIRHGRRDIVAWSWGDGPTIYLLHGWGGHAGQFHRFVEPLVRAGFSVVAIDAPGHGESEGNHASLVSFESALKEVIKHVGPAHAVIAHSMGAASTALAMHRGLEIPRVVFIASPSNATRFARTFAEAIGISEDTRLRMQERLERRLRVPWSQLNVLRAAREMTARLLLVHDENDRQVPWEDGKAITDRWPNAELLLTQKLGHNRVLRDEGVIGRTVEFLTRAE